ncbi:MAG: hypothetical protein BZY80_05690 [SAR202 cluster bacterium Io17-Chloro-G2]|nr:MAG: hypothetical protein BZY80_05690 [SAR202 cluster bacterium Io17-Chloro-G2]
MLHFHLKACSKCHGDLALDEGDWICLQCGTYYYTRLYRTPIQLPMRLPEPDGGIDGRIEDQKAKSLSLLITAVPGLSQFPDLAAVSSGLVETTAIAPDSLSLGSGAPARTVYDRR